MKMGIFENKEKHGEFLKMYCKARGFDETRVFENVMKRPGFFQKPRAFLLTYRMYKKEGVKLPLFVQRVYCKKVIFLLLNG